MDIDGVNKTLLVKSLNFHGVQLQKIFETEYTSFSNLQLDSQLHFNEYTKRQKVQSFQDRGKRFRLQQFICKHANKLFTRHEKPREDANREDYANAAYYPVLPSFEWFLNVDKEMRLQRFFEYVQKGDLIVATIVGKTAAGLILKILYGECDEIRCVSDVGIKAFAPTSALIPAVDKLSTSTRAFLINDTVCCEVLEVSTDTEKIVCGMRGTVCPTESRDRLGLTTSNEFSPIFKKFQEKKKVTYSELLEKSESFNNPNLVKNLLKYLGITTEFYSLHDYLKEKFPEKEYAMELRQAQAAKWSFHSVTEGIEHFKCGRYTEAFQCLNKALTIDSKNIEALVARGALYANSGNYEKAIADFENALKFNPNHQNAKKYLGDTLNAYGRTHEDSGKVSDAIKAYEYCLSVNPTHEEAQNSLQLIKNKLQAASRKDAEEPLVDLKKLRDIRDINMLSQLLSQSEDKQHLLREIKKLKMKKRESSSSDSSSSSESSSESSEESSSSSESSGKNKKKRSRSKKESSLSPLSKRMALMGNAAAREGFQSLSCNASSYNPSSVPYSEDTSTYYTAVDNENEYEMRVRKFLEETKKDDDYEEKVRKFLDETAKWKKKQKLKEEKRKKRKKDKKLKSKKKKRESKRKKKHVKESKKHKNRSRADSTEEYVLPEKYLGIPELKGIPDLKSMTALKDLEEIQESLSVYYSNYSKLEKSSKNKKEKHSREKRALMSKHKSSDSEYSSDHAEMSRHSVERKKPDDFENEPNEPDEEDDEPPPVIPSKTEVHAIKFKMQVPTSTSKLQKSSSMEHVWDDEKNESPEEPTDIPLPAQKMDLKEFNGRSVPSIEPITPRQCETPPRMDKLGGFHIKKSPSRRRHRYSPSRHSSRSMSRSRSRSHSSGKREIRHHSRSSSRKRFRHSRSHSRPGSPIRGKYSRYSRSRSYSKSRSRSRSRSPYYRNRMYLRGRGGGTYYKPRMQNYRGGFRPNWRHNYNNFVDRRNRNYNPNYRFNNQYRQYNRDYNHKYRNDRDYKNRHFRRSYSDDERGNWRDDSKDRVERKRSGSSAGGGDHREAARYEEFAETQPPTETQMAPEPEAEKQVE